MTISHTAYNSIGRLKEGSSDVWVTPDYVIQWAVQQWGDFTLDAAAHDWNAKAPRFFTIDDDALSISWVADNVWLNPPYGRAMPKFVVKAVEEVKANRAGRVVCLLASRTDTRVFQDVIFPNASHIHFIKGRLKFERKDGQTEYTANFASCFVVFDNRTEQIVTYGAVE